MDIEAKLGVDISKVDRYFNYAGAPRVRAFNFYVDSSCHQEMAHLPMMTPLIPRESDFEFPSTHQTRLDDWRCGSTSPDH